MLKMILLDSMDVRYFRIIPILYVYIYIYRGVWDMIGISKSAQSLLRRMFSSASAGRSKKQLLFVSQCGGWLLGRAANIKIWEMRFWEIELSNLQCISPKISIIYKHRSSFSRPFDNLTRYRFVLSRFHCEFRNLSQSDLYRRFFGHENVAEESIRLVKINYTMEKKWSSVLSV